jgi:hypothetical protein
MREGGMIDTLKWMMQIKQKYEKISAKKDENK